MNLLGKTSTCIGKARVLLAANGVAPVRARLPVILLAVVLFGLLGLAGKFMIDTWRQSTAIMSIHGYIALCLGVFFSYWSVVD